MIHKQLMKTHMKMILKLAKRILDTNFHATEESSEDKEEIYEDSVDEQPKGSTFIVYWPCLLILPQNCLTCAAPAHIKKIITKGSAICVHLLCQNGYFNV